MGQVTSSIELQSGRFEQNAADITQQVAIEPLDIPVEHMVIPEDVTIFETVIPYSGLLIPVVIAAIGWYFKSWITFHFNKKMERFKHNLK